jgi:hypothetical protein
VNGNSLILFDRTNQFLTTPLIDLTTEETPIRAMTILMHYDSEIHPSVAATIYLLQ